MVFCIEITIRSSVLFTEQGISADNRFGLLQVTGQRTNEATSAQAEVKWKPRSVAFSELLCHCFNLEFAVKKNSDVNRTGIENKDGTS